MAVCLSVLQFANSQCLCRSEILSQAPECSRLKAWPFHWQKHRERAGAASPCERTPCLAPPCAPVALSGLRRSSARPQRRENLPAGGTHCCWLPGSLHLPLIAGCRGKGWQACAAHLNAPLTSAWRQCLCSAPHKMNKAEPEHLSGAPVKALILFSLRRLNYFFKCLLTLALTLAEQEAHVWIFLWIEANWLLKSAHHLCEWQRDQLVPIISISEYWWCAYNSVYRATIFSVCITPFSVGNYHKGLLRKLSKIHV